MEILETLKMVALNAVASGAVLIGIAWWAREWFTNRIRESIKHEYDAAIEKIRADNQRDFVLFGCRLDALRALNRLESGLLPAKAYPDMEWEEAIQQFSFGRVGQNLSEFLSTHGPFLPVEVQQQLRRVQAWCEDSKFHDPADPQIMQTAKHSIVLV